MANSEFKNFKEGLGKILQADPAVVKAAMEQEKQERVTDAAQGKRVRGRPPKSAASSPASTNRNV